MQVHKKIRPESYEQFLRDFHIQVPEDFNFALDIVDDKARSNPDQTAMIHVDDSGIRRDYDFKYFSSSSSRLANALRESGIGKGDKVMLILYKRVEFWVSMLALHKLGAVAVPSPSLLTTKDIEYRVNFAAIKGAIIEDSAVPKVDAARKNCPEFTVLLQVGDSPLTQGWLDYSRMVESASEDFHSGPDRAGGNDSLFVYFSSGTTGPPKMVEHLHTYPLAHIVTAMYWHDLEPGDIHLTLSDTGWAKSVWGKFYGQWLADAVIFVWDFRGKFEPDRLLDIISGNKVSTFCAPPTVYRFLVRQDLSAYDLSHLRHCTTAGELLNASVFQAWKESTGLPIYEGYGQTETTLLIATFPFMQPKPGSIGKPSPIWPVCLLDADGNEVPPGEEGEICINLTDNPMLGLFAGYLYEQERTDKVLYHGFYHTGDKAWMDEDGYMWFLGRVDDLIKSSGYRIGPFEVESALITHEAVIEAAVTAIPDELRGQAVKATLVLGEGWEATEELTKSIQDHVKKVTAPYKYPRVVEYVSELPKTISGKIKRAEIRARDIKSTGF
ncbi:MAG: AMP-binding protein [Desulfonatronovibrionaceae bacterium]